MIIGCDVMCVTSMRVAVGSSIEVQFERNGVPLDGTRGRDTFSLSSVIPAGKRITATGRESHHGANRPASCAAEFISPNRESDDSGKEPSPSPIIPPAKPTVTGVEIGDRLRLRLKTNFPSEPDMFLRAFRLLVNLNGTFFDVPLKRPDVRIELAKEGEFLVTLDSFLLASLAKGKTPAHDAKNLIRKAKRKAMLR